MSEAETAGSEIEIPDALISHYRLVIADYKHAAAEDGQAELILSFTDLVIGPEPSDLHIGAAIAALHSEKGPADCVLHDPNEEYTVYYTLTKAKTLVTLLYRKRIDELRKLALEAREPVLTLSIDELVTAAGSECDDSLEAEIALRCEMRHGDRILEGQEDFTVCYILDPELSPSEQTLLESYWPLERVQNAVIAWLKDQGHTIVSPIVDRGSQIAVIRAESNGSTHTVVVGGNPDPPLDETGIFRACLAECLWQMREPTGENSIALPNTLQYRRLWYSMPDEAITRTGISALFIIAAGEIRIIDKQHDDFQEDPDDAYLEKIAQSVEEQIDEDDELELVVFEDMHNEDNDENEELDEDEDDEFELILEEDDESDEHEEVDEDEEIDEDEEAYTELDSEDDEEVDEEDEIDLEALAQLIETQKSRISEATRRLSQPSETKLCWLTRLESWGQSGLIVTHTLIDQKNALLQWSFPGHPITFSKTHRYLLIAPHLRRIGWGRVMKTRVTKIGQSVRWYSPITLLGQAYSIEAEAVWDQASPHNILFNLDGGRITLRGFFTVEGFDLSTVESKNQAASREAKRLHENKAEIEPLLASQVLDPFTYDRNLHGVEVDDFLNETSGWYKLRLGQHQKQWFVVCEET